MLLSCIYTVPEVIYTKQRKGDFIETEAYLILTSYKLKNILYIRTLNKDKVYIGNKCNIVFGERIPYVEIKYTTSSRTVPIYTVTVHRLSFVPYSTNIYGIWATDIITYIFVYVLLVLFYFSRLIS